MLNTLLESAETTLDLDTVKILSTFFKMLHTVNALSTLISVNSEH